MSFKISAVGTPTIGYAQILRSLVNRGVHQGWLRHSAAVKRTAKEGEPNGRNDGERHDGAGGLVGAPPRSWRRQVRRRATWATLLGEAEAASSKPAARGRTTGAAGTGAQRHGGTAVAMAGPGIAGRRGGAEGARARRPGRRDRAAEGKGRRDDHGDRAVAGEDCPPRGQRPFGTPEVEAMSQAVSPSIDRVYGLARVTRCWNVSRATVYRHRQAPVVPKRRPGPVGPCDDATLLEHIQKAIAESRFTGEGYRKIWARLRFSGVRSSPGRVRRLMRENGLSAPHRTRMRPDTAHDGTITTETVDVMWGTDMTQSVTLAEGLAHVFVAVDHCNSECVGIHADRAPTASRPWNRSARVCAGTSAPSARTWPPASCSGTTTDRTICPTTSRARSPSSASRPRRPSCASPRATASPSASSVHSRKTSCGCAPSRPSKSYAWRC